MKVSIVIAAYNSAKYLPECLNSLINQTYENIEIICVNDGSTDNTLSILRKYGKQDRRIKIYTKEMKEKELRLQEILDLIILLEIMF